MEMKFDVNKALSDLAEGLGIAVEKIYPVLYKQALIEGVYYSISLVFCVLLWYFIYRTAKGSIKAAKRDYKENKSSWTDNWLEHMMDKHVFRTIVGFLYAIGLLVFGIGSLIMIPDMIKEIITAFFNTDYYILNEIIEKLK